MPPQRLTRGKVLAGNYILDGGVALKARRIQVATTPTGAEQDTGFDLPAKAIVLNVYLDVTVAEAAGLTKTLNVGLLASEAGGNASGFLAGASVAATGVIKGSLVSTGQTLGALLSVLSNGGVVRVPEPHVAASVTAKSVSYTAGSADWTTFRGSIVIVYLDLNP